jgi:isopentenyl diphosphate isomerase/L-lactate dehydrogenase-like FMN-dependent dehydrogenase
MAAMPVFRRVLDVGQMLQWRRPAGRTPECIADLREGCRRFVPKMVFDYVEGGAGTEGTLRSNVEAFDWVNFRPRAFVDVDQVDTTAFVSGERLTLPVVLGPAGLVRLVRKEGELAAAKAAGRAGTVFVTSTASGHTVEEVRAASTGSLWFQLYIGRDRELSRSLVRRAESAGCATLVLTIDTPVTGNRLRDLRNGFSVPPRIPVSRGIEALAHLRWMREILAEPEIGLRNFPPRPKSPVGLSNDWVNNPTLSWADVAWVRDAWRRRLLVKGVMTGELAKELVQQGVDGIVVSNHGGRQLDGLGSSLSALPEVRDAVGDNVDVLMDGGIRSGADVVKALALGANAVMVARPWVWGLGAGGEDGVSACLEIFRGEVERTLKLLGAPSVAHLDPSYLSIAGGAAFNHFRLGG